MISELLHYEFAQNALVAMLLLSITAGIVGTYIVVRRMVFMAGGITHASFGGIGIAYYLGLSPTLGALVFAILTALGGEALGTKGKVRSDSAIAILWSFGMSVGLIFMFLTPGYAPNLMGFMFGDALTISHVDVLSIAALTVVVVTCAIVFYRPVMYVSFAPDYARLTGWRVRLIEVVMAIIVALAIVLSIKAVGIVLVLSLFTLPQAIANIFTKNLGRMMIASSAVAATVSVGGLLLAFAIDMPVGPVVTALLTLVFGLIRIIKK